MHENESWPQIGLSVQMMCYVIISTAFKETYTSSTQYDEGFFLNLSVH
jgi:hypothetical protein